MAGEEVARWRRGGGGGGASSGELPQHALDPPQMRSPHLHTASTGAPRSSAGRTACIPSSCLLRVKAVLSRVTTQTAREKSGRDRQAKHVPYPWHRALIICLFFEHFFTAPDNNYSVPAGGLCVKGAPPVPPPPQVWNTLRRR